jgi:hypothetical protein
VNLALSHLIEAASVAGIDPAPFQRISDEPETIITATLDRLSLDVAQQYDSGKMMYELADDIIGAVEVFIISSLVEEKIFKVPEISWLIFLAFDAGHFYHPDDQPGEDPVEKHTKPMISELLRKYRSTA